MAFKAEGTNLHALRGRRGEARSDREGRFRIAGLGAGPFVVVAETKKDAGILRARVDGVHPGKEELALELLGSQTIAGRVVDAAGEPVPRFRLHVARVVRGRLGETALERRTLHFAAPDGAFRIEGMESGRYGLSAAWDDVVTPELAFATLPASREAEPVVVRTVRAATVQGVVLAPSGAPLPGATVVVDTGRPSWMAPILAEPPTPRAVTDDAGRFVLANVAPGSVSLTAESRGSAPSAPVRLELQPGGRAEGVELRLRAGGTLTVEVLAEGSERAGLAVHLRNARGERRRGLTDARGRARFEHLEAGEWGVGALVEHVQPDRSEVPQVADLFASMDAASVVVADGETVHVVLGRTPPEAIRVSGRVEKRGAPYARAAITFTPDGGGLASATHGVTDQDGRYAVELDAPGLYEVVLPRFPDRPGDYNRVRFLREIPAVARHGLDLELPTAGLVGRVRGPDGEPAEGVRVTLLGSAGSYDEVLTDAQGRYGFPSLGAGDYEVLAGGAYPVPGAGVRALARARRAGIALEEGQWLRGVDFDLAASSTVTVEVVDGGGSPVAGATIFARDGDGRLVDALSAQRTDQAGRCTFQGIDASEHRFFARTWDGASAEVPGSEASGVRLVLRPATRLRVRLRDASGAPAAGRVQVLDPDGRDVGGVYALADVLRFLEAGVFSPTAPLFGPLPPGTYRIAGEAHGSPVTATVELTGEPTAEIAVEVR